MFKEIKRYIYGLSYKQSIRFTVGICIIVTILILDLFTGSSTFSIMKQQLSVTAAYLLTFSCALLIIMFSMYLVIIPYFLIFIKKADIEAIFILKNIAKSSDDGFIQIIPYYENDEYVMNAINFYREKENVYNYKEKELLFWLQLEDNENYYLNTKITLYITDKDNPDKIIYPSYSYRPSYIIKNFKIKQ